MKQGRAVRDVSESSKTEPVSKGVRPDFVSGIGIQRVLTTGIPMYEGRGLAAPTKFKEIFNKGSQGTYK